PGARRGGGEPRRRRLGHLPPRDAAAPQAGARGGRQSRAGRGARRLCDVHRALHARQSADRDRDHVEPACVGTRCGGGVRRDPHGVERRGPRRRSETMTALGERVGRVLGPDLQRLIVLIAVCFVDMIGLLMIAPLLTFYALRLGGQASTVGPLFSAFAVAQLLASPIWGRVDRKSTRLNSSHVSLSYA